MAFTDKAEAMNPYRIPATDAEPIITDWIKEAAGTITEKTGQEVKLIDLESDLSDAEWIWSCHNPEDEEDDSDFVNMRSLATELDGIVEDYTITLDKQRWDDLLDIAAHGIQYSTIYYANDGYKGAACAHTGTLAGLTTWTILKRQGIDNVDDILDRKFVTKVVIDTDANHIIQASGYNFNRGAFCDIY